MKSYLLKDVVVVENLWRLFLCWFLVDFKCPAPYRSSSEEVVSPLEMFRYCTSTRTRTRTRTRTKLYGVGCGEE